MSAVAMTPDHTVAPTWSERNHRWLSDRIAFWRDELSRQQADGAARQMPPETDQEFQSATLRLRGLFGLSAFETELLVLAAGIELDADFHAAVAQAHGSSPRDPVRVTFSLALSLVPESHWDAISPLGPLRFWSLIELDAAPGVWQSSIRIDERVLHYMTGVAAFDDRLAGLAERDDSSLDGAPPEISERIAAGLTRIAGPLVLLVNATSDASRRRSGRAIARAAFHSAGLRTLWVRIPSSNADARDISDLGRRIDREALLTRAGVALSVGTDAAQTATAVRLLGAMRAPVVALGALSPLDLSDLPERTALRFSVPDAKVSAPAAVSPAVAGAASRALQQFRVDEAVLEQALTSVEGVTDEAVIDAQVWNALRESARGGLDALAQRIESRATFKDLVVPSAVSSQLHDMANQLRHRHTVYEDWGFGTRDNRGLGIAALFSGESGTGKTLAAEVIANEAGLDLYRIDLASVVSKYIGETERNLSQLFAAAEHSGAVLLFDEADALFGKRSEVKDSHDRYANIEIAYLLQRIESYRGLAILTTNMKSALDRAFLRRIRFVVQFPFPDEAAREAIWRRQFPPSAPVGDVDFTALSRLQLSGGHIRSVAINAAFHAAAGNEPIDQDLVIAAARSEFAKLERTFTTPGRTP
ncbi:MAG TPA: ATP-binding protein [Vicinamibacterales bacterium]|nr:ATP-binding protein [Vicinamibacterales bacterium]